MSCNVNIVQAGDAPVLLAFHQGVNGGANEQNGINISYEQKGCGKKRKRIVTGKSNDGMTYKGTDFGEDSLRMNSHNYAIGMLDEHSGEFVVVPADHVFVMNPSLETKKVDHIDEANTTKSSYERKQSLAEAFGSKKKQRAIEAAQSNIISSENIAGSSSVENVMIKSALKEKDSKEADDTKKEFMNAAADALDSNRKLLLPPYDTETDDIDSIYPLDGLIPSNIMKHLEEYYDTMLHDELKTQGKELSSVEAWEGIMNTENFIASDTMRLIYGNSKHIFSSKKGRKQFITRAIYLHCLMQFYVMLSATRDRRADKDTVVKALQKNGLNTNILRHITDTFSNYKTIRGTQHSFCGTKSLL